MARCPFHCSIVPTHILENIAQTGSPAQRRRALRSLALAASDIRLTVRLPPSVVLSVVSDVRR